MTDWLDVEVSIMSTERGLIFSRKRRVPPGDALVVKNAVEVLLDDVRRLFESGEGDEIILGNSLQGIR